MFLITALRGVVVPSDDMVFCLGAYDERALLFAD